MAAFFILLRKATVSATVPPARAQHTHTLRHTRHTPLPSHGARPREQLPRRPARHGIQTILPAFPHKAQDTRHTLRTPHLVPEYALYDKAARIAADGFRFSRRASPRGTTLPGDPLILRRPHSFPETRIRPRNHSFSGKPCALRRISAPSGVTRYTPVDSGVMWPMTSTHPMRITCSCKASGTVNNNS